jgi:hypothetical protein
VLEAVGGVAPESWQIGWIRSKGSECVPVPGEVEALVRDEERMRRVALSEERTECHDSLDFTTVRRLGCMMRA